MNGIRVLNRCLWGLNGLIALAIGAQVTLIVMDRDRSFLEEIFEPVGPSARVGPEEVHAPDEVLLTLPNPIGRG